MLDFEDAAGIGRMSLNRMTTYKCMGHREQLQSVRRNFLQHYKNSLGRENCYKVLKELPTTLTVVFHGHNSVAESFVNLTV